MIIIRVNHINGVLGHDSVWQGYTGPNTTWANEINSVMNHAPGAGSLARPVDQQSIVLPLCYCYPLQLNLTMIYIDVSVLIQLVGKAT